MDRRTRKQFTGLPYVIFSQGHRLEFNILITCLLAGLNRMQGFCLTLSVYRPQLLAYIASFLQSLRYICFSSAFFQFFFYFLVFQFSNFLVFQFSSLTNSVLLEYNCLYIARLLRLKNSELLSLTAELMSLAGLLRLKTSGLP